MYIITVISAVGVAIILLFVWAGVINKQHEKFNDKEQNSFKIGDKVEYTLFKSKKPFVGSVIRVKDDLVCMKLDESKHIKKINYEDNTFYFDRTILKCYEASYNLFKKVRECEETYTSTIRELGIGLTYIGNQKDLKVEELDPSKAKEGSIVDDGKEFYICIGSEWKRIINDIAHFDYKFIY